MSVVQFTPPDMWLIYLSVTIYLHVPTFFVKQGNNKYSQISYVHTYVIIGRYQLKPFDRTQIENSKAAPASWFLPVTYCEY